MNWYAIFVETNKEDNVQKWLGYHFDSSVLVSMVPKRRLKEKRGGKSVSLSRTLFPGYVFIKTDIDDEKYYTIKRIPNTIKLLTNNGCYSKIADNEMDLILRLAGENSEIDYSKIYVENSRVHVIGGPLVGLEGIIKKVDRHKNRARVQINLLGEPRFVDIGVEFLDSVGDYEDDHQGIRESI